MKGLLTAAALAIAALGAGCANQPNLDFREYAGEPVKSFYMPQLDGWAAVSKNQLVVWAGAVSNIPAMRPISVCIPVAKTTAWPRP